MQGELLPSIMNFSRVVVPQSVLLMEDQISRSIVKECCVGLRVCAVRYDEKIVCGFLFMAGNGVEFKIIFWENRWVNHCLRIEVNREKVVFWVCLVKLENILVINEDKHFGNCRGNVGGFWQHTIICRLFRRIVKFVSVFFLNNFLLKIRQSYLCRNYASF